MEKAIKVLEAIDVKIDGISIGQDISKGITIRTDNKIKIVPQAANSIIVSNEN